MTQTNMSKSDYVLKLDAIQAEASSLLRPLGFRKLGRSHNRITADDLVHVVTFQLGEYPIGDYVIPGIRESCYGTFAVNLGVLLPCVYRLYKFPMPKTVRDGHCSIRSRLHSTNGNEWFSFENDSVTPASIVELLKHEGLPFLFQFETYNDVMSYFNVHGILPEQNPGRASLEAALVARELGDIEASNRLFIQAHASDHKGFRSYVAEIAARFGHVVS